MIPYLQVLQLLLFQADCCGQVHSGLYLGTVIERVVKEYAKVALYEGLALLGLDVWTVIPLDVVEVIHVQAMSFETSFSLFDEDVVQLLFHAQQGTCACAIVGWR